MNSNIKTSEKRLKKVKPPKVNVLLTFLIVKWIYVFFKLKQPTRIYKSSLNKVVTLV